MNALAMRLPRFMRRKEVRERLGVTDEEFTKLVRAEAIKPHYFPRKGGKKGRAVYLEHEVMAFAEKI